ncbi:molecular chaperone [Acinetobacter calcoaceticus]|uniref:fimbrial biogenesis chaperone n=1 Tax=Acinetobacter calcoaceticus TaxID=471 RepID=UPI00192A981B|nr:fimbria/pilus periplasmic chaperone [Acinetobacter calcoaceticus]
MRKYFQSCKLAAVVVSLLSSSTFAGVTITGTRIIFPANQQATTVQLNNSEDRPAMVQAWLDNGDSSQIPEAGQIPFILTPPLTRLEAKKGQMIRLIAKDTESLPKDRESVYWFNILDIPAVEQKAEDEAGNKLQVSVRSRIKLFYRPEKLKMPQEKAFSAVTMKYDAANKVVSINNPSPYYISFERVDLKNSKDKFSYTEALMVAPFATETFKPDIKFKPTKATYLLINDYGGSQTFNFDFDKGAAELVSTEPQPMKVEVIPVEPLSTKTEKNDASKAVEVETKAVEEGQ